MKKGISLFFLCLPVVLFAQKEAVLQGRVFDAVSKLPLENASVSVRLVADTAFRHGVLSGKDGKFRLSGIPIHDSLLVEISFNGYTTFTGRYLVRQKQWTLPDIFLEPAAKSLEEVTVTASQPVQALKGDTIEFKAGSFKTPPNSATGELLKRLPGLTIDPEGKMSFHGKPVTRILVDGKEFFGADGVVALQQIPANLLDKIQITDLKTVDEELSGKRSKGDAKVLNLKLKPGQKYFGNGSVNAGTSQRYDLSGFASRTTDYESLSVTAGTNNLNRSAGLPGLSVGVRQSGPQGIIKTVMGGVDYSNNNPSGKSWGGSYQFARPETNTESVLQRRQNIVQDSALNSRSLSNDVNRSTNHSLRFFVNSGNLGFGGDAALRNFSNSSSTNLRTYGSSGELLNEMNSNQRSEGREFNYGVSAQHQKSFAKKGRFLTTRVSLNNKDNVYHDRNQTTVDFYRDGFIDSTYRLKQAVDMDQTGNDLSMEISYTEPIDSAWHLNIRYGLDGQLIRSNKVTYNLDSADKRISLDSLYSNHFSSSQVVQKASLTTGYSYKGWNIEGGLTFFFQQQRRVDKDLPGTVSSHQSDVFPYVSGIYGQPQQKTGMFILSFLIQPQYPRIEQLQPVPDNANPTYRYIGNPNLRPALHYFYIVRHEWMSIEKNISISTDLSYMPVPNYIVSTVSYDALGNQLISYRNINGTYGGNGKVSISKRFKAGSGSLQASLTPEINYSLDKVFLNDVLFSQKRTNFNPSFQIGYTKGAGLDISLYGHVGFQHFQQALLNQNYTIYDVKASVGLYFLGKIKWKNEAGYNYNNMVPEGFRKGTYLWNTKLSYLCFKNKKGELTLTVFDILDQNRGLSQLITDNYIQNIQYNNLQRYFMAGFTYYFDKIKQ